MLNTKLNILFGLLLLLAVFILCGCGNAQINFNRKSVFGEYTKINNITSFKKKPEILKPKGFIIYKSTDTSNRDFDIDFGPSEINFNLPK